jgi:hypothetical protein
MTVKMTCGYGRIDGTVNFNLLMRGSREIKIAVGDLKTC